jgi:hypothetical protein
MRYGQLLDPLEEALAARAFDELQHSGGVIPFGAAIDGTGQMFLVCSDETDRQAAHSAVLEHLRSQASADEIVAAGTAQLVVLQMHEGASIDALAVMLEEPERTPITVMYPYQLDEEGLRSAEPFDDVGTHNEQPGPIFGFAG